jgi:hypothetical protein
MFEKEREFEILEDFEQYDSEYEEPEEHEEALEAELEDTVHVESGEYEFDRYLPEEEKEEY